MCRLRPPLLRAPPCNTYAPSAHHHATPTLPPCTSMQHLRSLRAPCLRRVWAHVRSSSPPPTRRPWSTPGASSTPRGRSALRRGSCAPLPRPRPRPRRRWHDGRRATLDAPLLRRPRLPSVTTALNVNTAASRASIISLGYGYLSRLGGMLRADGLSTGLDTCLDTGRCLLVLHGCSCHAPVCVEGDRKR
jgi:hypothetical protein